MKNFIRLFLFFVVGTFIFTGVPLLSWGVSDAEAYFASRTRMLYTIIMAFSTLLAVIFVPQQGRDETRGVKLVARQKLAVLLLQILSILCVIVPPISDKNSFMVIGNESLIRPLGLILTAGGFLLMNLAILALGKQFSVDVTIQKGHELVTKGPYSVIRHPRYLGIILFFSGISLVFRSFISLVLVFLTALVLIWRIFDEEKLMRSEFSGQWDDYAKRSSRLIPFLY